MSSLAVSSTKAPVSTDLYLKCHKPQIAALIEESMNTCPSSSVSWDVAKIVAGYVISERDSFFGRDMWLKYWDCDVVDPVKELDLNTFYKFWLSSDPIKPGMQICDTHIPPVLRPRVVTHISTGISYHYSLNVLGELIKTPKEGHRLQYYNYATDTLRQNGKTKAEPACWLTMRKDVVARGQPYIWEQQAIRDVNTKTGVGYEEKPSALDLATVVSAHQVVTGERHLGDDTGAEGRWTFSRSGDTVRYGATTYQVVVGGNSSSAVGGDAPGGLGLDYDNIDDHSSLGFAGLRKFLGH